MAETARELTVRLLADLRPALEGWADPVAFGVGLDGAVYAAARCSDEATMVRCGGARFPKARLDKPADWMVVRWSDGDVRTFVHHAESIAVSHIQPLSADAVLLVGARCCWTRKGPEKNAVALDWTGRELGRLTLGDGIQDVRVAPDGTIWVSYFDEGVVGNHGWGNPGPVPLGSPGLVAFTLAGEVRFAYDSDAAATDAICDAYAMTVDRDGDAWVYFHTEFPIVRIRRGAYQSWSLGAAGAHALAVQGDRAFLFGDYKRRSLGRVVRLGYTGEATITEEVTVVDPSGEPLITARGVGAGERMLFVRDRQVLVLDEW